MTIAEHRRLGASGIEVPIMGFGTHYGGTSNLDTAKPLTRMTLQPKAD
jgi:aryl-alcohol dehydrogenase-like predicted oxidoreductase